MRHAALAAAFAAAFSASPAWASYTTSNQLSFGHAGRISAEGSESVPHFQRVGSPEPPQVLSNKIILTGPAPGAQRGAIWADDPLDSRLWQVDVDFRASGPDRAGGNFNIWLVRGGSATVGHASIYTVGPFDGFALVIDSHSGSGGSIRGFLNDGTIDYSTRHSVDELAFGHCAYAYRNLGRPSQIQLTQTADNFRVEVDSRVCFESNKVSVPVGNKLGISAATPENPDSFEVFKLVTKVWDALPTDDIPGEATRSFFGQQVGGQTADPFGDSLPDTSADVLIGSREQFTDLHNRMQILSHHITTVFRQSANEAKLSEDQHGEVKILLADLKAEIRRFDPTDMQNRLSTLEIEVRNMRVELHKKVHESEHSLKGLFQDHQGTMYDLIRRNAPAGHARLIWVILLSQCFLVAGYVVYKRSKNTGFKKFV